MSTSTRAAMSVAPPSTAVLGSPGETEARPPKLRSSCDDCGAAKVKCNRERPKCGRCETLNLNCVYGPSRKFGKPPRKRLKPTEATRAIQERLSTARSSTADSHRGNIRSIGSEDVQNTREYAHHNLSHPTDDPVASSFENEPSVPQNQLSDFLPSMTLEEWPQLADSEWQQLENFGLGLDLFSAPPSKPASVTSKSSQESHSCPRESYEIFRDLICPSPSLHAPESNSATVTADLDQVLQFNRNAINRLSEVLRCPCAKSGHRAMVHASIVSRILIWYQQAAGWTGNSSWGPRPSKSTAQSTSSPVSPTASPPKSPSETEGDRNPKDPPSLVQATGFAVEHVPISIGAFSIEDEHVQAAFRNQLVLSELKKAAELIKLFMSQDSDKSSAGSLYSHLGMWLQSEHSKIVTILRSRLRTLNEDMIT